MTKSYQRNFKRIKFSHQPKPTDEYKYMLMTKKSEPLNGGDKNNNVFKQLTVQFNFSISFFDMYIQ